MDGVVTHKNPVVEALAKRMMAMKSVLPSHITPERMSRISLGMLRTNQKLAQVAMRNPESFVNAVLLASQLGLEPGVQGMAYLVPYGNEIQMIPGYRGLISLMRRSGEISSIEAHLVYENDEFDLSLGLDQRLLHKPNLTGDRGKPILAYCIAKFKDGGHHLEWMSIAEINRIRDTRSKTSKAGPWVDDYEEMCRKTVVRRAVKYLPMSVDLQQTIVADDAGESGARVVMDGDFIEVHGDESSSNYWTEYLFQTEYPTWKNLILSGKKTAEQIITMANTKAQLTTEQEASIRALQKEKNSETITVKV